MRCECADARISVVGPIDWRRGTWCMCFNCGAFSAQQLQVNEMMQQYFDGLHRYLNITGASAHGLSSEV